MHWFGPANEFYRIADCKYAGLHDVAIQRQRSVKFAVNLPEYVHILYQRIRVERRHDTAITQIFNPDNYLTRSQRLPLPLSFVEPMHSANDDIGTQSPSVISEGCDRTVGRHQQRQNVESLDTIVPLKPRVRPRGVTHIDFAPRLPIHQRFAVSTQRRMIPK